MEYWAKSIIMGAMAITFALLYVFLRYADFSFCKKLRKSNFLMNVIIILSVASFLGIAIFQLKDPSLDKTESFPMRKIAVIKMLEDEIAVNKNSYDWFVSQKNAPYVGVELKNIKAAKTYREDMESGMNSCIKLEKSYKKILESLEKSKEKSVSILIE